MELVGISNTVTRTIHLLLRGYNKIKDSFKIYKYQLKHFQCECRIKISTIFHGEDSCFSTIKLFQQHAVQEWNPISENSTTLIIIPVSIRDGIKTDRYVMAIIELLCL